MATEETGRHRLSHTGAVVEAGRDVTGSVALTIDADKGKGADTLVGRGHIGARAIVQARRAEAVVDDDVTLGARVAGLTHARVAVGKGHTRAQVVARLRVAVVDR